MNVSKIKHAAIWMGLIAVVGTGSFFLWRAGKLDSLLGHQVVRADSAPSQKYARPELLKLANGAYGLKVNKEAVKELELSPITVSAARVPIPLPPMIGSINYDNECLFAIKPRFTGEISQIKQMNEPREFSSDSGSSRFKITQRGLKFGDKVKQGDTLVVFWSQSLGMQKAAFVDAICNLRLSQAALDRQNTLFLQGAMSAAALKVAERQVQTDNNAVLTAERTLRMWKLTNEQIAEVRVEANIIHDQKVPRDVVKEVEKWARVEVKVPMYEPDHPERELTVVEKNTHINDMVDPANYGTPLFRIADLTRLQIWAHPPEEYLPILRERLKLGPGALTWNIRFQSEPANSPGLVLDVAQISPSLEPNQHTPMMLGYVNNPDGKYLIGQFVTATILIPPPPDTVAIPTEAVNQVEGKDFVFVLRPGTDDEFLIRRVSVAQSFKKNSLVRSKLLPEQERANQEMAPDSYKFEALLPGDRIAARGVLELTAALEDARNANEKAK
jgi:cobalt-zinc-cadmium efflux system membrane fusion protein